MAVITKNLGQVAALYVGLNPPSNTKMLWYDQNVNALKYYNTLLDEWALLTGVVGNGSLLLYTGTAPIDTSSDFIIDINIPSSYFIPDNIIISQFNGSDSPLDLEIWDGPGRTGNLYYTTNIVGGDDAMTILTNSRKFISVRSGDIVVKFSNETIPTTLYLSVGTPGSSGDAVNVIISGYPY